MDTSAQPGDTLLGKYRVERVLGRGGMGVVLAARHVELGQMFALKLLLPRALDSANGVQRFLREARAAALLRSEHVARVIDVGRLDDGAPYMVMEYLEGSDLSALLRSRGPLPCDEAIEYVLQACNALAEAHAAGIVHRDLKPANLFLTHRPDGSPLVKVLDFGISKQAEPAVELTQTGAILGSPQYMAPEQIRSTRAADARSDVWSMGVVLYKLVTGVLPFPGDAAQEVIAAVLQDDFTPPSAVRPGLPEELDAVLARALQKKPDHRFQRIEHLAAALRVVTGSSSVTVPMPVMKRASAAPAAPATDPAAPATDPTAPAAPAAPTLGGASFDAAMTLRRRSHRVALAFATAGIAGVLMLIAGFLIGSRWGGRPGEGAAEETQASPGQGAAHSPYPDVPAGGDPLPVQGTMAAAPPAVVPSGEPSAAGTGADSPPGAAPSSAAPRPGKRGVRSPPPPPSATAAPAATAKPRTIF